MAGIIAFVFAFVARKANLFFLAIATLALSELIIEVVREWQEFTGQIGGEVALTESQRIELFGWKVTSLDETQRPTSATSSGCTSWRWRPSS